MYLLLILSFKQIQKKSRSKLTIIPFLKTIEEFINLKNMIKNANFFLLFAKFFLKTSLLLYNLLELVNKNNFNKALYWIISILITFIFQKNDYINFSSLLYKILLFISILFIYLDFFQKILYYFFFLTDFFLLFKNNFLNFEN